MIVQQRESFSKPQLQSIKADLRRQKREDTESVVQEKEWWIYMYLARKDNRRGYRYCYMY